MHAQKIGGAVVLVLLGAVAARAATINVINTKDSLAGSLRQAIQDAMAGDTINFKIPTTDAGYDPVARTFTIVVASGELVISKNLTIDGGNQRVVITRTGGGTPPLFRVLHVMAGTVTITGGLTITGGYTDVAGGAGLFNEGTLSLSGCTVSSNFCPLLGGGGIENLGLLTATNCTIANNATQASAGAGVLNDGAGVMTLVDCTVVRNAILTSNNSAGAGIHNAGTAHIQNTVVALNTITSSSIFDRDVRGDFISDGYNFIGISDGSTGFGNSGSHDQVGTSALRADPNLGGSEG